MREFFMPWRRKLACVTLVLACLFMGVWIRSLFEFDTLFRLNEHNTHLMTSSEGTICWQRIWPIKTPRQSRWVYRHYPTTRDTLPSDDLDIHWELSGLGFDFSTFSRIEKTASGATYDLEFDRWEIPYWSIVMPLGSLSAWLLLSKPRRSKSAKVHPPDISNQHDIHQGSPVALT